MMIMPPAGGACGRQQSRPTHQPAQHALQPHNQASPSSTAPYDPRFQPPAGCWRAHTGQPSQLAGSSHSWRARRPGTARGPAAGPFPTLPPPPLHLNARDLGPGSPPPRLCPRGRAKAAFWSKKRPIAAKTAPPPDVPSSADRAHRLHRPVAQQHRGQ